MCGGKIFVSVVLFIVGLFFDKCVMVVVKEIIVFKVVWGKFGCMFFYMGFNLILFLVILEICIIDKGFVLVL